MCGTFFGNSLCLKALNHPSQYYLWLQGLPRFRDELLGRGRRIHGDRGRGQVRLHQDLLWLQCSGRCCSGAQGKQSEDWQRVGRMHRVRDETGTETTEFRGGGPRWRLLRLRARKAAPKKAVSQKAASRPIKKNLPSHQILWLVDSRPFWEAAFLGTAFLG